MLLRTAQDLLDLLVEKIQNKIIDPTKERGFIWQLFIDDKQQVMARWPNAQFIDDSIYNLDFWAESDATLDSNGTMNTVSSIEDLASSGINAQGALAIANVGSWKTWVVPITSHTTGSNILFDFR